MNTMQIRPLFNKVVVDTKKHKKEADGGIILPDNAQEPEVRGTVLAIGPAVKDLCPDLRVNDIVVLPKFAGTVVRILDTEYKVINVEDIVCRLVPTPDRAVHKAGGPA